MRKNDYGLIPVAAVITYDMVTGADLFAVAVGFAGGPGVNHRSIAKINRWLFKPRSPADDTPTGNNYAIPR